MQRHGSSLCCCRIQEILGNVAGISLVSGCLLVGPATAAQLPPAPEVGSCIECIGYNPKYKPPLITATSVNRFNLQLLNVGGTEQSSGVMRLLYSLLLSVLRMGSLVTVACALINHSTDRVVGTFRKPTCLEL